MSHILQVAFVFAVDAIVNVMTIKAHRLANCRDSVCFFNCNRIRPHTFPHFNEKIKRKSLFVSFISKHLNT